MEQTSKTDLWGKVKQALREQEEAQRREPKVKDLSWALGKEDEMKNEIMRFMCNKGRMLRQLLRENGCAFSREKRSGGYIVYRGKYQGLDCYVAYHPNGDWFKLQLDTRVKCKEKGCFYSPREARNFSSPRRRSWQAGHWPQPSPTMPL